MSTDGLPELLSIMEEHGGVEGWMAKVGNKHKTSTHKSAIYKAQAIRMAAQALVDAGVPTTEALLALDAEALEPVKKLWLSLPGQRSGISWRYMLMLAGVQGVKPDRMIMRFIAGATGLRQNSITVDQGARIVTAAAELVGSTPTELDHAIWSWQRTPANTS